MKRFIFICSFAFCLSFFTFGQTSKVSDVSVKPASPPKPSSTVQGKNNKRKERNRAKKGISTLARLPSLSKIGNALPVKPDNRLRMEIAQIESAAHWIDRFVSDALAKAGQKPNSGADDFIFVRRTA